jgi:hypothetical protein
MQDDAVKKKRRSPVAVVVVVTFSIIIMCMVTPLQEILVVGSGLAPSSLSAAAAAASTTPTTHSKKRRRKVPPYESFNWTATVDKRRGLASSREVSLFNNQIHLKGYTIPANVFVETALNIFEHYPIWLCTGWVSFGLLRAVPIPFTTTTIQNNIIKNTQYEIRTRLGNLNLLTFDHPSRRRRYRTHRLQNTVLLPIIGGMMSYNNYTSRRNKKRHKGHLYFTIEPSTQTTTTTTTTTYNIITGIEE